MRPCFYPHITFLKLKNKHRLKSEVEGRGEGLSQGVFITAAAIFRILLAFRESGADKQRWERNKDRVCLYACGRELTFTDAYLKRTQDKVKHQPHIGLYVTGHEGEDDVVYSKQGDQKESRLCQSPANQTYLFYITKQISMIIRMVNEAWIWFMFHKVIGYTIKTQLSME